MVAIRVYKAVLQCLFLTASLTASSAIPNDSLQQKDYKYLFSKITSSKKKPEVQQIYLKAFLDNAKAAKDWELIMNGYKNYADHAGGELSITYADSMVYAARRSEDDKLIGSALLSKGIAFYALKRHELALDNYLLAKPYIERSANDYLRYKLRYNIGHVKYYLGKNEEAIQLFDSCLAYFKANNERAYFNTLHSLGLCYTKAGNYGKSEAIVQTGLQEAARLDNHTMDAYFLHLEGQNYYFGRNYDLAIRDLEKSIPGIEEDDDYANVAVANFYIGKSYWALKRFREGLPYLQKVAQAFKEKEYIRPDLRENFELLIKYYKSKNEPRLVLHYVDELLKADSLLLKTHDNLYDNIHKNYDTKELILNKQNIERQLSHELSNKRFLTIGAVLLLIISTVVFVAYEKNRRRQNRIFRELISQEKKEIPKPSRNVAKELEIAQETIDKILRSLEKWEQSKRFLEKDITQTSLAVYLETNVRYLSDIILDYRGKKFSDYINDLKVDYIIEQLKSDRLKRMYTHEALAKEAGFSTTQRFVQAFKARTGISPNFFSAKIRKEMAKAHEE